MTDRLQQLSDAGVAIWLDDISRDGSRRGNLGRLIDDQHVVGVTTNPTIFARPRSPTPSDYDDQVTDLAVRGVDARGGGPR